MISKVIHYCWFGRNPLPALAVKCIKSWQKYLPDYEIKEWNEDNFDVNIIPYTQEAYQAKKYAFVSDYARFWILYKYGGLYFDTDVEIVKPIDDIIACGSFMGCELNANSGTRANMISAPSPGVNPGLGLGAISQLALYQEILNFYSTLNFLNKDNTLNLKTVVHYTTEMLYQHGLRDINEIQKVAGIWVYPKEYFCPLDALLRMNMTENSRTIHHFSSSWLPWHKQLIKRIKRLLGYSFSSKVRKILVKLRLLRKS